MHSRVIDDVALLTILDSTDFPDEKVRALRYGAGLDDMCPPRWQALMDASRANIERRKKGAERQRLSVSRHSDVRLTQEKEKRKEKPSPHTPYKEKGEESKETITSAHASESCQSDVSLTTSAAPKTRPSTPPDTYKHWDEERLRAEVRKCAGILNRRNQDAFVRFWAEPSASGKLRFHMQKTWDTKRRMMTWADKSRDNTPDVEVASGDIESLAARLRNRQEDRR